MIPLNSTVKQLIILFALIFSVWFFFFARTDFYEMHRLSDMYVIPLYKPYKLINVDDDSTSLPSWGLDFKLNSPNKIGAKQLNVTDINVTRGIIYGHGKRTIYEPNDWFAIVPDKKIELTFKAENDWKAYLKHEGIDPINLFQVWLLFYQYQKKSSLPWHNN